MEFHSVTVNGAASDALELSSSSTSNSSSSSSSSQFSSPDNNSSSASLPDLSPPPLLHAEQSVTISITVAPVISSAQVPVSRPRLTKEEALKSLKESIPHTMKLQQLQKSERTYQKEASWHKKSVRRLSKELYLIVSLYALLQGAIFAAVAQSSVFGCPDWWGPIGIVGAVTLGTISGVLDKLRRMGVVKQEVKKFEARQSAVYSKIEKLYWKGSACDLDSLDPAHDEIFDTAPGKNKMEEYPILTKFYYTVEELHEEYGLSIEGVLPKDLTEEDLPHDQWLTVFKQSYQKNAKIYLNQVHQILVEDCRFLFHKVFQTPPSCGEITAKFARCFAFERCHVATKDPVCHKVAWARFGENVLNMCASRPGGLERKVETWRRVNGASHGGLGSSIKKARLTQSGSSLCIEVDPPQHHVETPDYVTELESIVERVPKKCAATSDRLKELRESLQHSRKRKHC